MCVETQHIDYAGAGQKLNLFCTSVFSAKDLDQEEKHTRVLFK